VFHRVLPVQMTQFGLILIQSAEGGGGREKGQARPCNRGSGAGVKKEEKGEGENGCPAGPLFAKSAIRRIIDQRESRGRKSEKGFLADSILPGEDR